MHDACEWGEAIINMETNGPGKAKTFLLFKGWILSLSLLHGFYITFKKKEPCLGCKTNYETMRTFI